MKGKVFVDSNILVYQFSETEPEKSELANSLLLELMSENRMVWSTQVIQEFYAVMTKKYKVPSLQVKKIIEAYSSAECVINTPEIINKAIDIQILNTLSFWDSLVLSSAKNANCTTLLSEDMNAGQFVNGILITNPFLTKNL